jgi:hypothetical protein
MEIVEIGINDASTFKGYCPKHDAMLFSPVDSQGERNKSWVFRSLHLRAMSLELCRKRRSADFMNQLKKSPVASALIAAATDAEVAASAAKTDMQTILSTFFFNQNLVLPIDFFAIGFNRNLGVAACGVFDYGGDTKLSTIGYHILPYKNSSLLVLTCLGDSHKILDPYFSSFKGLNPFEQMVNDIAFLRGEEPLISPAFWYSLTETEKLQLRQCLMHPYYRNATFDPRFVRIEPSELIDDINHETWSRLFSFTSEATDKCP